MSDDDVREPRSWRMHCEQMADTTEAIARWCEAPDMRAAYMELAARWMRMAGDEPSDSEQRLH